MFSEGYYIESIMYRFVSRLSALACLIFYANNHNWEYERQCLVQWTLVFRYLVGTEQCLS
jgi:hypothetical protein